ncbi:MAG: acyl carrier protein [Mariprofundaceae bacterium]|nr:acyl carrier protein [Mariprofundaceae bacterium]
MTRETIIEKLSHFLSNEFPNQGGVLEENTNLLSDWFLDSLGTLEIAMFLEEEFDIDVQRADINGDNFHSMGTLTDFILSRI